MHTQARGVRVIPCHAQQVSAVSSRSEIGGAKQILSLQQGSQEVLERPINPPMYRHMPQFQKSRTDGLPLR